MKLFFWGLESLVMKKKEEHHYTHNSTFAASEPAWGTVNKSSLPDNAFADPEARKYPHHWISKGKMYLHRGGLIAARAAAHGARTGKKASPAVLSHLNSHPSTSDKKD